MHPPSLTALIVILVIVLLIFGTKKLRNVGGDLGAAIRNFRSSMKDGEADAQKKQEEVSEQKTDAGNPPKS
jgi:sec-independent protein translocase protein TatA